MCWARIDLDRGVDAVVTRIRGMTVSGNAVPTATGARGSKYRGRADVPISSEDSTRIHLTPVYFLDFASPLHLPFFS